MKPQNSSSSSKQLLIGLGALVVALAAAALFFLTDRGGSPPPASQEGRPAQLAQQQPAAPGAATTGAPQSQALSSSASSANPPNPTTAAPPPPSTEANTAAVPANLLDNPQLPAADPGKPLSAGAAARVQVNGRSFDLTPNKLGQLPRVYVQPKAQIPVEVYYHDAKEGDAVSVQVEDGGQLDGNVLGQIAKLDGNQKASFNYRVSDQRGSFRVVVRKGTDVKTFDFWVGAPLPVAPIEPLAQQ